ncbi:MAG: hypothetical protein WBX15_20540 [Thermoanaerobaculia bacterium]
MMTRITLDLSAETLRRLDRIVKDGWYADRDSLVTEALEQFVESRSFLGDSPRLLHHFAADALNESKPEIALKFVARALSLMNTHDPIDLNLYQQLVELRVQILLILGLNSEALESLKEARERLPNNPNVLRWMNRVQALV